MNTFLCNKENHLQRKIYILRHEQRFNDISFDTHLTDKGIHNAIYKICPNLLQLQIDEIYCSPFVRTLETIKPYCDKTGKKVNIEWGLVESQPSNPKISSSFDSIINHDYISYIPYSYFENYSELDNLLSFNDLISRVSSFLNSTYKNKNILLVTHMPVINAILSSKGLKSYNINTYHNPGSLISLI